MADEIIKELWEVKDAIAQEHGWDINALVTHLREKRHKEDEKVVDLRSIKQTAKQRVQTDPNHAEVI
jgi:hypothetical protein